MRIGVLEDDEIVSKLICLTLERAGHDPRPEKDGRQMLRRLRQESFDLLLLDWQVPEVSGLEVLAWARANLNPCPPAIMVTTRDQTSDIVSALEIGADDYIGKPFEPSILVARVEAVLRRAYGPRSQADRETIAGAVLDHKARTICLNGTSVVLTAKEFELATILLRNINRPLSRAHLLETVWGNAPDLATRTLDTHISKIRSKLPLEPNLRLVPIHGFGYRLEEHS